MKGKGGIPAAAFFAGQSFNGRLPPLPVRTVCNCCGGYPDCEQNDGTPEKDRCHCIWEPVRGPEELGRDDRGVVYGWGEGWHCQTHNYSTDQAEREVK